MPTSTRAIGKTVFMIRCGKFAIAPRADRGVRPYRTFYGFAEKACNFAIASCAGGVEPRPYGDGDRFYEVADGVYHFVIACCTILQSASLTAPFTQGSLYCLLFRVMCVQNL